MKEPGNSEEPQKLGVDGTHMAHGTLRESRAWGGGPLRGGQMAR